MTEKLAGRIVRLYPRAWRERYEQEMLALLEQSPGTWGDVVDLARAGAWEWLRTSRPVRTATSVAAALIASAAASVTALGLRQLPIDPPTFAWLESPLLSLAFLATLFLAWMPVPIFVWWREFKYAAQRRPGVPPRLRLGQKYWYCVVVYTVLLMITIRWGLPSDVQPALNSVAFWIDWGTIVLVGVFGDLLDVLARGVHSQSSQGHGPMALGPRQ
jgi:hypothetical protein